MAPEEARHVALKPVAGQPTVLVPSASRRMQQVCSKLGHHVEAWLEVPSARQVQHPCSSRMPRRLAAAVSGACVLMRTSSNFAQ